MAAIKDREANGRFKPGHHYAKGNPFATQIYALRNMLYAAVSYDDFSEVIKKLLDLAKIGNIPAAKLLMEHLIGKPIQAIHLTGQENVNATGVSAADIQIAVVEALVDEPAAKLKVAQAFRRLHDKAKQDESEPCS